MHTIHIISFILFIIISNILYNTIICLITKNKIISNIYKEYHGSRKDTLEEARKKDPSITYENVKTDLKRISWERQIEEDITVL